MIFETSMHTGLTSMHTGCVSILALATKDTNMHNRSNCAYWHCGFRSSMHTGSFRSSSMHTGRLILAKLSSMHIGQFFGDWRIVQYAYWTSYQPVCILDNPVCILVDYLYWLQHMHIVFLAVSNCRCLNCTITRVISVIILCTSSSLTTQPLPDHNCRGHYNIYGRGVVAPFNRRQMY